MCEGCRSSFLDAIMLSVAIRWAAYQNRHLLPNCTESGWIPPHD